MREGPKQVPRPERVHGDGIVLRPFASSDEDVLRRTFADLDTGLWNPGPADGDVRGWWHWRNDWSGGDHASWAVADAVDDRLVGMVSLYEIDPVQADAEVGYSVVPDERGQGIAGRALAAAARYAFDVLGLHRLELFHGVENVASCTVARSAGFVVEGTLRQSYRYGDGRYHDEHAHARLATDPVSR